MEILIAIVLGIVWHIRENRHRHYDDGDWEKFFIFVKIIVKRLIYSSFLLLLLPYSSIQTNQKQPN